MTEAVDDAKNWRRSTYCANTGCVEVAEDGDRILMRDSKNPSQPHLGFDRADWREFIDQIRSGHLQSL